MGLEFVGVTRSSSSRTTFAFVDVIFLFVCVCVLIIMVNVNAIRALMSASFPVMYVWLTLHGWHGVSLTPCCPGNKLRFQ